MNFSGSESPSRPSSSGTEDRFIPSRLSAAFAKRNLFSETTKCKDDDDNISELPKEEIQLYDAAIRNETLKERNTSIPMFTPSSPFKSQSTTPERSILLYSSPKERYSPYFIPSTSPISEASKRLLLSPRRVARKIPKLPYRILDAPELQDDFYLNMLDWSSQNVLAVGLGASVYMWNAGSGQVFKLCDLSSQGDLITSVAWSDRGQYLAVGTDRGFVNVWDTVTTTNVTVLAEHVGRVGSLAWNGDLLFSGSRDRSILLWDQLRSHDSVRSLTAHTQEVCGLKCSADKQLLASGGNDNKLYIWNMQSPNPVHCFTEHVAAVKALAWCPQYHNLLASGGGTADRTIRFWNSTTGQQLQYLDSGSQVCNLCWSQSGTELVSTHGYSLNQIILWRYPSMTPITKLPGHNKRVLYMAMSPDGESIVTGAGDETLRFWSVFSKVHSNKEDSSPLKLLSCLR